jgi:hypothetical protein
VEDIQEVRNRISRDPHAPLVFASITGTGLRVCVWGPKARNADQYEEFYKAIAQSKSKEWGLEAKLDRATFDCSRLCFLPYDPEITFAY